MMNNKYTSKWSLLGLLIFTGVISFWIWHLGQFEYEITQIKVNNYRRMITTAYSRFETCRGKCLTASGKPVREGMVASNCLPFGTKMEISGKQYIVEDRHAKWLECRIDIFMEGYEDAINYGKQTKLIKIIK